jgi:hypothetical protein
MNSVLKKTIQEMLEDSKICKAYDKEETWEEKAKGYNLKKGKENTWRQVCEKYVDLLCAECGTEKGKSDEFHEKKLCYNCSRNEKYELICKTKAKKEYHMKDDDLEDLKFIVKKNPHCKNGSEMVLYSKCDVISACKEKYNVSKENNLEDFLKELDKGSAIRGKKMIASRNNKKNERLNNLVTALENVGLELRNDSKLCDGYIDGVLGKNDGWTIPTIVNRMCQMKYLYEYCDMEGAYQKAKKEYIEELKAGYYPDVSVEEMAEEIALKKQGGRYPNDWPWLKRI